MRVAMLVLLGLFACANKSEDSPPAPKPARPTSAVVPIDAGLAGWPATLEDRTFDIAWHDMHATLKGRVPVGWISRSAGSFKVPDNDNPGIMDPSISWSFGGISCDGECDDGDMQKNMASAWHSIEDHYSMVSYNMGETDKLRMDVKVLAEGPLSDGTYKAVRVTLGSRSQGAPSYLERLEATCVRHRKGDPFYIIASAHMKISYEQTLWPLVLEACKTPWFRS